VFGFFTKTRFNLPVSYGLLLVAAAIPLLTFALFVTSVVGYIWVQDAEAEALALAPLDMGLDDSLEDMLSLDVVRVKRQLQRERLAFIHGLHGELKRQGLTPKDERLDAVMLLAFNGIAAEAVARGNVEEDAMSLYPEVETLMNNVLAIDGELRK